jgi:hypothetical protein
VNRGIVPRASGIVMTSPVLRSSLTLAALASAATLLAAAQRPAAPTVSVALTVAGTPVTAQGPGECVAAEQASLYEVPGRYWNVRHDDTDLNVTLWRMAKGGDGVTLTVMAGGKTHRVNTAAAGPAANRRGSGTASFVARGTGGTITVDLVADSGVAIKGQVTCSAFGKAEDNGR